MSTLLFGDLLIGVLGFSLVILKIKVGRKLGLNKRVAVSYTHLDVYKRQVHIYTYIVWKKQ